MTNDGTRTKIHDGEAFCTGEGLVPLLVGANYSLRLSRVPFSPMTASMLGRLERERKFFIG